MKKNIIKVLVYMAILPFLGGCYFNFSGGSFVGGAHIAECGETSSKVVDVNKFENIVIKSNFDVTYHQTEDSPFVEITADNNLIDYVRVESEKSSLKIKCVDSAGKYVNYRTPIKVAIYGGGIDSASLSGSCKFYSEKLDLDSDFNYAIAGSGSMLICELKCKNFNTTIAGSGDVKVICLKCDRVKSAISGSGDISLLDIDADELSFSISGSGDGLLGGVVRGEASVKISGAGDVDARDLKCGSFSSHVSGSGKIKR